MGIRSDVQNYLKVFVQIRKVKEELSQAIKPLYYRVLAG